MDKNCHWLCFQWAKHFNSLAPFMSLFWETKWLVLKGEQQQNPSNYKKWTTKMWTNVTVIITKVTQKSCHLSNDWLHEIMGRYKSKNYFCKKKKAIWKEIFCTLIHADNCKFKFMWKWRFYAMWCKHMQKVTKKSKRNHNIFELLPNMSRQVQNSSERQWGVSDVVLYGAILLIGPSDFLKCIMFDVCCV